MSDLYRLVYASRNLLDLPEQETRAEIEQILQASQANNDKVGVTGALMFNAGAFAQVLEGPRRGVEATFERIQRDIRHADVTVLQCGPAESRGFANWSMAFVGQSDRGRAMWNDLAAQTGFDLSRIGGDQVFSMLRDLVLDDESVVSGPDSPEREPPVRAGAVLDTDLVRAEIELVRPDRPSERATAAAEPAPASVPRPAPEPMPRPAIVMEPAPSEQPGMASLAIVRTALAEERQRTTDLRTELDDLRIALAEAAAALTAMRTDRDHWAKRARLLATIITEEASEPDAPQVGLPSPARSRTAA